jgi:hypothetical protein
MKIVYDTKEDMYLIKTEYPETEIWIKTNDIVKARVEFVERMTRAFNDAVCDKFKDDITKYLTTKVTNQICQSDFDHEWECCGVSTNGSNYRCKKCYAHKFMPYTSSSSNHYKGE